MCVSVRSCEKIWKKVGILNSLYYNRSGSYVTQYRGRATKRFEREAGRT